ncbi:hypothetical protein BKD03_08840 [Brucella sp. 09RB8471]|nr:hypothetical protein BKD03_08840 [Brucella sp. 09RB8471]
MKNPSIFSSSQKRGVLIPICSCLESVTFRESEAILTLPEVCQQPEGEAKASPFWGTGHSLECFSLKARHRRNDEPNRPDRQAP